MTAAAIYCSFTAIDELVGKKLTITNILKVLSKTGCFSVFDAVASRRKARMLGRIEMRGLIRRVGDSGYPWIDVEVTEAGRKVMECAG